MPKRLLALLLAASLPLTGTPFARASAYDAHPKLIVIVVIDQFRADYLQRYRAEFRGRGFRLFLDRGAYFPDCYYGYGNTKTAPGHATLGTGSYSDGHGINSNEWWDLARNKQRPISSVEDDRYTVVSTGPDAATATPVAVQQEEANTPSPSPRSAPPNANQPPSTVTQAPQSITGQTQSSPAPQPSAKPEPGASPRNLLASTIGDELRLATGGASRVYGVSLKDRAAILPAGTGANGAFWIDSASGRWVTSSYYMQQLPAWAQQFNTGPAIAQAAAEAGVSSPTNFYSQVGVTNAANTYEINFAEALIAGESLGAHPTTDLLTLSLSPNDIEGHHYGPDSPEEHTMITGLDGSLDSFFTWLDTHVPGGLGNVVIALSADHGIAPVPAVAAALGLPAAYISTGKLVTDLNQAMNAKFSPGEHVEYVLSHQELPYLSLNRPSFERAGINETEAEDAVKAALEPAFATLAAPSGTLLPIPPPAPPPTPAQPPISAAPTLGKASASRTAAGRSKVTAATSTPASTPAPAPAPANVQQPPAPAPPRLAPNPQLFRSYTRVQLAAGEVPPTEFGQLMAHSYSPNGGWYVAAFPIAFQMEGYGNGGTTHFSPYSYDRHVPLGFFGAPFLPGTYRGSVEPVDLAVTLASLLGINLPSAAVGHVLTQALRPTAEFTYPREPAPARHTSHIRRGAPPAASGAAAPTTTPPTPQATQP